MVQDFAVKDEWKTPYGTIILINASAGCMLCFTTSWTTWQYAGQLLPNYDLQLIAMCAELNAIGWTWPLKGMQNGCFK